MILQDLIKVWQAQPFRAFRLHTPRGTFTLTNPLVVALSPEMRVVIVSDAGKAEDFSLDEIERAEVFGPPVSLPDVINAIPPDILARDSEILSAALKSPALKPEESPPPVYDAGKVSLLGAHARDGIFLVYAAVSTKDGQPMFGTAGTRWNLHGMEQFENGTSLYLHHLDHPTVEQRVILWPPDKGTLESFAEAKTLPALMAELSKRDAQLAAKPAKIGEPPAAYFRQIKPEYPRVEPDGYAEAFGTAPDDDDFDRFELRLVEQVRGNGIKNPYLTDVPSEDIFFNLGETNWNATFHRGKRVFELTLNYVGRGSNSLRLTIDPYERSACVDDDKKSLPLTFVERHLRNYALYEPWEVMMAALHAGPVKLRRPDIELQLAREFRAEMWAGDPRSQLPFLQPRILNSAGQTLLDLRATTWSAYVRGDETKPLVTLRLAAGEIGQRPVDSRFELTLDLVTHRVTCAGLKGSTTLGMIQALVRRVRGLKWLAEDLPAWFEKGRLLPLS